VRYATQVLVREPDIDMALVVLLRQRDADEARARQPKLSDEGRPPLTMRHGLINRQPVADTRTKDLRQASRSSLASLRRRDFFSEPGLGSSRRSSFSSGVRTRASSRIATAKPSRITWPDFSQLGINSRC
jgi:hypothetical protein